MQGNLGIIFLGQRVQRVVLPPPSLGTHEDGRNTHTCSNSVPACEHGQASVEFFPSNIARMPRKLHPHDTVAQVADSTGNMLRTRRDNFSWMVHFWRGSAVREEERRHWDVFDNENHDVEGALINFSNFIWVPYARDC